MSSLCISFHSDFPDDNVALFSQTQTTLDQHFVKTRNKPTKGIGLSRGFSVLLEGAAGKEASALHKIESVGWAGFQHGVGALGHDVYQAAQTGKHVTHKPYGIAFCAGFYETPRFFASIMSYAGSDPSQLRLSKDTTTTEAHLYIQVTPIRARPSFDSVEWL